MNQDTLRRLQSLNQLALTEAQTETTMDFFSKRAKELTALEAIDTADTLRMVHVMPLETVVREDVEKKLFTRDQLQQGAPEAMDGYWQVPRLVE